MKNILNSSQAARAIGCCPQKVRERIRCGVWTFGEYIPAARTGQKLDSYEINANHLARWLQISVGELEERIK